MIITKMTQSETTPLRPFLRELYYCFAEFFQIAHLFAVGSLLCKVSYYCLEL